MKRNQLIRLLAASLLLLTLLVTAVACNQGDKPAEDTTAPDTIETVPPVDTTGEPETEPETAPTVSSVKFPASKLPDYDKYTTANRIKEVLGSRTTYAVTANGTKYYANGELKAGGDGIVTKNPDGTVTLDAAKLGALVGKSDLTGTTPEEIAKALGMGVAVYDHKLVLFYEGAEPLHTYDDLYTYEAMYLYMTDAAEEEIINAFIDLPSRISNDVNNSIFYTAPDLNLGIQTSVYYAQMGQMNGLSVGPALVAGEGKHPDNFTTVRIYNDRQTCITQFLAFDPSVKGGVQVAAAKVGDEVLIATAPFAAHDGSDGDVRVFDAFGLIRMTVKVRDVIPGPHYIVTGHFAEGVSDEVLLVASQTTNDKGELRYAILSLSDGSVISEHTLDCSFALTEEKAGVNVALSVRNSGEADTVILYFHSVQAVYEGNAQKADFKTAGIRLPADATGVSASNVPGQKYIVALPVREGQEVLSFLTVYDENSAATELDVGFRENRFFAAYYTDGYNDDKYVSRGNFCHIRTDLSNNVISKLGKASDNAGVDNAFDSSLYADYAFSATQQYVNALQNEYLFLEPCFTHRWNKIPATGKLASYVDPITGLQKYVSVGKAGEYMDYNEIGSSFYVGTYADGILDLAKLRVYPLRSFLQGTAVAFRGDGANPEHLVGVSPVHEHEIDVAGSVGDYNPYMLEGFRGYMLERYESVEKINATFGTSFADRASIDAPRDSGRGAWDAYSGAYFAEWTLYNRAIVSKRIMEAYREALLAGYPPEAISAHQIPEGEAVAGFLGEAHTRLTPIDVVLTCGTAYGGTRYGNLGRKNNLVYNAHMMGHSNISLGEYGSLHENPKSAYNQLKNLWENGLRMVHHITFNDNQAKAEEEAIKMLMADNEPRPGYTGGTTNSVSVTQNGKQYNIIQIGGGADSESTGLLKSIDSTGKWEGTVYLVPFHTQMAATAIEALNTPVEGTQNQFTTGELTTIKNSDQVEITFAAAKNSDARAWVEIATYYKGCLVGDSTVTYELTDTLTPYRYVLSNQLYGSGLEVKVTFHTEAGDGSMDSIKVESLRGTLQTETCAFSYYDGASAYRTNKPHQGGVTFDLLGREMLG
ncbi:MAG: family 14 glycosylhydrolase [Clostridia bacterium]|nr:family 14 glycosylhydrolase [Clostridia bacterium]